MCSFQTADKNYGMLLASVERLADHEALTRTRALVSLYSNCALDIPVDLEKLVMLVEKAVDKKIKVEFVPLDDDGYTVPFSDGFSVKINSLRHPYRQRLTLCHEQGHILVSYTSDTTPRRKFFAEEERLCNEIAMHLLCPPEKLHGFLGRFRSLPYQLALFSKKQPELAKLEQLAERFEVPTRYLIRHIKKLFFDQKIKKILSDFDRAS